MGGLSTGDPPRDGQLHRRGGKYVPSCPFLPSPFPAPAPAVRKRGYGDPLLALDLPPQRDSGKSLSILVASCPFTTSHHWSPKLVPVSTGGLTGGCESDSVSPPSPCDIREWEPSWGTCPSPGGAQGTPILVPPKHQTLSWASTRNTQPCPSQWSETQLPSSHPGGQGTCAFYPTQGDRGHLPVLGGTGDPPIPARGGSTPRPLR